MTLNSKHRTERLKTKNKRDRYTKNQNPKRLKSSFNKRIGRKCNLYQPVLSKVMTTRK